MYSLESAFFVFPALPCLCFVHGNHGHNWYVTKRSDRCYLWTTCNFVFFAGILDHCGIHFEIPNIYNTKDHDLHHEYFNVSPLVLRTNRICVTMYDRFVAFSYR